MTSSESLFSNAWNDASESDAVYSKPSVLAIIAFLLGLASFLVFFTAWLAFFGILGILVSLCAISIINRSEGIVSGLKLAQCGLACSIISLVAVGSLWPVYQYGVQTEADRFFRIWFEALREDNIPLARGLASPYWSRPSSDDPEKWWTDHYANPPAHRDLHQYLENSLIRTLLVLGNKAKVSFYQNLSTQTGEEKDTVVNIYAVSYPVENGKTETFFVKIVGERMFPRGDVKSAGWLLASLPEFVVPEELKSEAKSPGTVRLAE